MSGSPARSGSVSQSDSGSSYTSGSSAGGAPAPAVPSAALAEAIAVAANGAAPNTIAALPPVDVQANAAAAAAQAATVANMVFTVGFEPGTPEDEIREYFAKFGEVTKVELMPSRKKIGPANVVATITFATAEAAKAAIDAEDKTYRGANLVIEPKRAPREPREKREREPREPREPRSAPRGNRIHVTGFGESTTKEELSSIFTVYGEVTRVDVVSRPSRRDGEGTHYFASVAFSSDAAAAAAVAGPAGEKMTRDGHALQVEMKKERRDDRRDDRDKHDRATRSRGSRGGAGKREPVLGRAPAARDERCRNCGGIGHFERECPSAPRGDVRRDDRRRDDRRYDDRRDDLRFDSRRDVDRRRERSPRRFDRSPPRRDRSPRRFDRSPPRRDRSPRRFDRSPPRRDRSPDRRRSRAERR